VLVVLLWRGTCRRERFPDASGVVLMEQLVRRRPQCRLHAVRERKRCSQSRFHVCEEAQAPRTSVAVASTLECQFKNDWGELVFSVRSVSE